MRWIRLLALGAATGLVAALAVAVAVNAARRPADAVGGAGAAALALQIGTALALWAAGLQLALRRGARVSGWLIAATGPALLAGALPLPDAGGAALFALGLAAGLAAPALIGCAALLHPAPSRRFPDLTLAGAALAASFATGIVPAVLFDPRATGCFECPRNLLLVHGDAGLRDGMLRSGLVVCAAAVAVVVAVGVLRLACRPALVRRASAPVVVPALVAAGLGAVLLTHGARAGGPLADATSRALWLSMCGALAAVAAGVGADAVRARLLRGRIAALVLDTLPSPGDLRSTLAAALGAPALEIVFPVADGGRVDAQGRPAGPPQPSTAVTEVRRAGELVAELRHDVALAHTGGRVAAAARGAALALEHASLQARLRAELAQLAASRARVIEAADAERRRLERDLHDGAQQRLIALTVALGHEPALARAHAELRSALHELREIAHGIHPVTLSDAGLEAALRAIADGSRVPLRVGPVPRGRLPAPVESATHRLVADAVGCAERAGDGGAVEVEIARADGLLRARLRMPGVRPEYAAVELEHSADRLAALGGRLEVGPGDLLEAELPCAS
jgi:signal transduction histidine kinase